MPVQAGMRMRAAMDGHDWSASSIGPMVQWPASLRTVVNLMLDSAEPVALWWGEELLQIYNDAYAPRVDAAAGGSALGTPAAKSWAHSWPSLAPLVQAVLCEAASQRCIDFPFDIERGGRVDEAYWTFSLTPLRDDAGAVRGIMLLSTETTARVLAVRREQTLELLRQQLVEVRDPGQMQAALAHAAHFNPNDLQAARLLTDSTAAAAPSGASRHHVAAVSVGVDVDLVLDCASAARVAPNLAYRAFLEQCCLLLATVLHRLKADARRRIIEAERDRLLLDAPVGAAVMIGEDLVYHLVNAMYAAVSGRPAERMVNRPFLAVFPELEGSPVHEKFKEVYRVGHPFVSEPTLVRIHRHGGALEDRYFTYNLSPLRTLAGEVYGLMVIAVDITVQVTSREQVEGLNVELRAAARAKDEFLALLGHEMRNPLAPIVTALDLMRMRGGPAEREQVIIRRQVTHLTRLVDDLLDVSRITRGKVELRMKQVDAREVILRAVEMVLPLIEQKQQRLATEVPSVEWYGDPARLTQIVSNLLTNAARYSANDGAISLRLEVNAQELRITVADDGMGLSADLLPRVFEPFVQGNRELRSGVGGLGIGLALVKNLSELHGGHVSASSEGTGRGSVFTVVLPRGADPVTPTATPSAVPALACAPRHILVVDDNIDAADTVAEALRPHHHQVEVAYTAQSALQLFAAHKVDIAILDIGLPEMSGHELARQMRQMGANAHCSYVALSGFGQQVDKARSNASGFAAHLVKPLLPEVLERMFGTGQAGLAEH
ncbi:MAG: ATP-binding protein [Massilia sp.]